MQRDVADRGVRAGTQDGVVLDEQPRIGGHVVVEEEQVLATGHGGTAVAGGRGAGVGLLDHTNREGGIDRPSGLGAAVGRAVDDHDELDGPRRLEAGVRTHAVDQHVAALVRRHDDADAVLGVARHPCPPRQVSPGQASPGTATVAAETRHRSPSHQGG